MAEKITNQPNYWVRLKLYREMLEREQRKRDEENNIKRAFK